MSCTVTYSCKITQIGTLVYHNLKINGEKWNYPDSSNPTSTESEIKKMVTDLNCREDDLITFGFMKGWVAGCPD